LKWLLSNCSFPHAPVIEYSRCHEPLPTWIFPGTSNPDMLPKRSLFEGWALPWIVFNGKFIITTSLLIAVVVRNDKLCTPVIVLKRRKLLNLGHKQSKNFKDPDRR
jgi:hypothetical protein